MRIKIKEGLGGGDSNKKRDQWRVLLKKGPKLGRWRGGTYKKRDQGRILLKKGQKLGDSDKKRDRSRGREGDSYKKRDQGVLIRKGTRGYL